jgi:CMP/dCMP kinase
MLEVDTVIPLDGPTSSGKTSVGYLFAKKIGFAFIDSGAIYRAGAIAILEKGVVLDNEDNLAEVFKNLNIDFKDFDGKLHTFLNEIDVTDSLHNPEVTAVVPIIAGFSKVREEATWIQREVASRENTVMAGRDIGTEIFPDVKLKFYLTADIQIRAHRRFAQLREKIPDITYEQVLGDMIERDKKDMTRLVSPLRIPAGAVIIDTTNHTTEESVERMLEQYNRLREV